MSKAPRNNAAASELIHSLRRAAEQAQVAEQARERTQRLEETVRTLAREVEARERIPIAGVSSSWKDTLRQVGRVAPSNTTVLITGETGTGKEVIARLVHQGSPRADRLFMAVNCAALPEQLLESELFGHERGAFTGAAATKIGRFEQAAGGTLFLDEIAEMSPLLQAKLLRVLESREFQRLGGSRTIATDVRVVAATNRDLTSAVSAQTFREDLYYRLNVFRIHLVPLRLRADDIPPLAVAFLEDLGARMARPVAGIARDALDALVAYAWPGNIRELKNAIERALLLCDGGPITREHLPAFRASAPATGRDIDGWLDPEVALPSAGIDLEAIERLLLEKALKQAQGNKTKAAHLLGLTRAKLYSRMEKHGMRD